MSSQFFGLEGRVFVVSLGLMLWLTACGDRNATKKVLVIGIDGIRVDILAETNTPNIDQLIAEGFFSDQARTNVRTVSGPGWSSMLIGARTDKHLVDSNNFTGNDYTTYPDFLTRLEQVDSSFSTFAVVDWAPLGTTASGGPLFSDAIDELLFFNGGEEGYGRADALSVDAAVDRLATEDLDAAFVYIGDTDEVAHATSTYAPEYKTAIEVADVLVGRLVAAIQARPRYAEEDWLILVSCHACSVVIKVVSSLHHPLGRSADEEVRRDAARGGARSSWRTHIEGQAQIPENSQRTDLAGV